MPLDNNSNNDLEKDGPVAVENTPFIFVPSEEISQNRDLVAKSLKQNYDTEHKTNKL